MQNIVTLGQINDALKITSVTAAQLAEMGFAALENKPICEALPPEESRRLRNAKIYQADSIAQIRVALAKRLAAPASCLYQIQEPPTKTEALAHYSQQAILAMGEAAPAVNRQLETKPAFYTAIAEQGGKWIPLPEYAAQTDIGVLQRVVERAREEGWIGDNAMERLKELGWACRPVYFAADPSQAAPAAVAVPDERDAFEIKFPMPADCVRCGTGYASTSYNGWRANDHVSRWEGWHARAALAATPAAAAPVVLPEQWPTDKDVGLAYEDAFSQKPLGRLWANIVVLAEALRARRALLAGVSAPAMAVPSEGFKLSVYSALGCGSEAAEFAAVTCIQNLIRRESCLSAVERQFFMVATPPDEDEGETEPGEECLLNWGQDPEQYAAQFEEALKRIAPKAQADARDAELAKVKQANKELSSFLHDEIVAQQAAWIEWRHGAGAEAAMSWIENGLCGPGHIPDEESPYGKEAQAWFDANKSDPFPLCQCGRPSNSLWMGKGFCSNEHYNEHRAAIAAAKGSKS